MFCDADWPMPEAADARAEQLTHELDLANAHAKRLMDERDALRASLDAERAAHREDMAALRAQLEQEKLIERERCVRICNMHIEHYKENSLYPAYGLDARTEEARDILLAIKDGKS